MFQSISTGNTQEGCGANEALKDGILIVIPRGRMAP